MQTDHLVLAALDRQENIAIVLAPAVPGRPPMIAEANDVFHRLTGLPRKTVGREPLTVLAGAPEFPPEWHILLEAIATGSSLRGEVPCFTASQELFWFGFTLTHVPDARSGQEHPVLTGRDITVDRWEVQQEGTANALLALAFMNVDVPVVLLRDGGQIIAANHAIEALTGFNAEDLDGKHIRDLTHPDDLVPASPMHLRQNPFAGSYRLRLLPLSRDGQVIPVWLTSVVLESAGMGRVHVVTLLPEMAEAAPEGRVETVSLQAVRTACGEAWDRMSGRLVQAAESIVKQRIGPRDVFARAAGGDFSIWFATGDEKETAARVAGMTREIRIRVLGELGEDGLNGVIAAKPLAAPGSPPPPQGDATPKDIPGASCVRALQDVTELSVDSPVEVTRIMDRDDRAAGLVWADLTHGARLRLDAALAGLPEDALIDAGLVYPELLQLRFAIAGIKRDLVEGPRRAWLLPISCAAMLSRKRRKRLVEALKMLQTPVKARLRGLLADVPPGYSDANLRDWLDQLQSLLLGIGVLSLAPDLPAIATLRPPCDLVAVDLWAGLPPAEDAALRLVGAARRLGLPLLVRTRQLAEARLWRDRGAALFAVTRSAS
jgi:PAS domain S-box-containing protein